MARGEAITARVEAIAAGGAGFARHEGRSVFAELTAPGDLARLRISEEKRGWIKAELEEIIEPSPLRVNAPCPLYARCGGCSLQHLAYDAQIKAKETILKDSLARIGGIEAPKIRVEPSAPFGYRNRVQFHCFPEDRRKLGFMQRKGIEILPLKECPVADMGINNALKEGRIVPPPQKDRFTVYSRGGTFLSEGGQSRGKVSLLGKEILMDAQVFFQSNAAMLETLLEDLQAIAEKADHELPMGDMYCGVGTFANFLGGPFPSLDLLEENKAALALARENARGQECRFYAISDDAWVKSRLHKENWGFMVIDPPRQGLSALMRSYLAEKGPPLLAYVSCDPATLARDSKELARGGYALKELSLYDFYPQTAHIESLSVFSRNGGSDEG
ncbi:class I SAM-dependent RNA methyltransferase [Leadbettera azotonutricia]|uniref:23S rRNA (Uracil-5-)-methyltransferase RumA n=1 Tax=Leadbettera azotonutricia (strain ATCC BAA-888 / DSM 13862 / ZAS-9) TaxID=545695 RepID=F5YE53_LEAAZ|nr:class I SAM-dependent RNA methyltransferase [Leadbettera azotonutricia]AEF80818.1 23S rRNA (uracil-5-)-methyltransferase RumA [Leadbettera azotonutricia ZAS-9]